MQRQAAARRQQESTAAPGTPLPAHFHARPHSRRGRRPPPPPDRNRHSQAAQHVDHIFRGNVAGGALRIRAAAQPSDCSEEGRQAWGRAIEACALLRLSSPSQQPRSSRMCGSAVLPALPQRA